MGLLARYTHWLHTRWPAGTVERLPISGDDGETNLAGVRIVGDLTGIPLLKFSSRSGANAVRAILREIEVTKSDPSPQPSPQGRGSPFSLGEKDRMRGNRHDAARREAVDLAIIGAGVAGISAAIEAKK